METPLQTAARLLAALREMAEQEALLVRSLDLVEAAEVTERMAPLVARLCELAEVPAVGVLRPAVREFMEERLRGLSLIDAHLARLQGELRRVDEARHRLARVAPVYSSGVPAPESRLNTAA
jgi:hypothetical protein